MTRPARSAVKVTGTVEVSAPLKDAAHNVSPPAITAINIVASHPEEIRGVLGVLLTVILQS
jgi:hypothetical protein